MSSCHFTHRVKVLKTDLLSSGEDRTSRYVAEENIELVSERPTEILMQMGGKYFKRWDDEKAIFVSNIEDEYPEG